MDKYYWTEGVYILLVRDFTYSIIERNNQFTKEHNEEENYNTFSDIINFK